MENLSKKLKSNLINQLVSNEQIADEKYIVIGNKSYSRRDISIEIENETEFGIDFLSNMILLAIDLTSRKKV